MQSSEALRDDKGMRERTWIAAKAISQITTWAMGVSGVG